MQSLIQSAKRLLPNQDMRLPIVAGPFRGAAFFSNPQVALRKVFGLYEHELNPWLTKALGRANAVIDVGANDGYFTFGAAHAMRRASRPVRVIAIEPTIEHTAQLAEGRLRAGFSEEEIKIVHAFAGDVVAESRTTLDALHAAAALTGPVVVKIDVEGAELEVLAGATRLLTPESLFLIEVHKLEYIQRIVDLFTAAGLSLVQVNQKPLPLLGREHRDEANWWLISSLA